MNISLNPHFEELVKGKVESGLYNSVSEVMREALRLLEERDQLRDLRLEELRQRNSERNRQRRSNPFEYRGHQDERPQAACFATNGRMKSWCRVY